MRLHLIATALLAISSSVWAQDKVWTPAPVPTVGAGDTIQPAARAGERVLDDHSSPFSSVPTDSIEANGATSADTYNGVSTPDLSK